MENKEILHSWKEISLYLERDIKTCYRWERDLNLPVHRIDDKSSRSKVFAYKEEIDKWLKEKANENELAKKSSFQRNKLLFSIIGFVIVISIFAVIYFSRKSSFTNSGREGSVPQAFDEISDLNYLVPEKKKDENSILNRKNGGKADPWQFYHQGKYYMDKCTEEGNEVAVEIFLNSLKIDKKFPMTYIGLAQCYTNSVRYSWKDDIRWLDKAENLLAKAEVLSAEFPEYYSVLAEVFLLKAVYLKADDLSASFRVIQEGLKKYPNHPRLNSIAGDYYYIKFGREGKSVDFDNALIFKDKGFWLNPYALSNVEYAELLMLNGEFSEAIDVCSMIEKFDSSSLSRSRLGEIYYYSGDLEKSESIFDQLNNPLNVKISSLFFSGMIAAQKGEKDKVFGIIEEIDLLTVEENASRNDHLKLASMYFGLGFEDKGYQHLELFYSDPSVQNRRFCCQKYIALDKNFNRYRNTDRFILILHKE
jgi:tetratricopeptide (TPR) repeat protein